MKQRINFSLKEEYKKSWQYLKDSKKFIYGIIVLFVFSVLIGFFVSPPESLLNYITEFIQNILEKTQGLSQAGLISFIFLNNIQSSFFGMVLGVLFGIFPILATISNGYILGFVSSLNVSESGVLSLWRIFPHGIFELPALFISLGLGLKFGTFIFYKNRTEIFRKFLIDSIRVFVFIVLPLLIIAAIIEGSLIFIS